MLLVVVLLLRAGEDGRIIRVLHNQSIIIIDESIIIDEILGGIIASDDRFIEYGL